MDYLLAICNGMHYHFGLQRVDTHNHCCGMTTNYFKHFLHLPVVVTQGHDIVGISEVRHLDVSANLNPWVVLQDLTKSPADNIVEEDRRGDIESPPLALTFMLVEAL